MRVFLPVAARSDGEVKQTSSLTASGGGVLGARSCSAAASAAGPGGDAFLAAVRSRGRCRGQPRERVLQAMTWPWSRTITQRRPGARLVAGDHGPTAGGDIDVQLTESLGHGDVGAGQLGWDG